MSDPTLTCPECGTSIKLNESLAGPLLAEARNDFAEKLRQKNAEMAAQQSKLEAEQAALGAKLKRVLEDARAEIAREEAAKAAEKSAHDIAAKAKEADELREALRDNEAKLARAQEEQAMIMKERRALEDEKRELELTVEKRLQEEVEQIRTKAKAEQESVFLLKLKESELKNETLAKKINDLNRRAEQGSQQSQGEALEVELEDQLAQRFPWDKIEEIKKGESGADVLQSVMSPNGKLCGSILWETKRTKSWSGSWIPKLKTDQRAKGAQIAVLLSTTLPKEMLPGTFTQIDGVWVTGFDSAMSMVGALRMGLIEMNTVLAVRDGQASKAELIYDYLTGTKFRHRIEAINEKFDDMRKDLVREKKFMAQNWAKRETQIDAVTSSTLGMHGDLQGIAGSSMPEIGGLDDDVPLLDEG